MKIGFISSVPRPSWLTSAISTMELTGDMRFNGKTNEIFSVCSVPSVVKTKTGGATHGS